MLKSSLQYFGRALVAMAAITAGWFVTAGSAFADNRSGEGYLTQPVPETWGYTSPYDQDETYDTEWWHSFNDPVLDTLVACGKANNFDVLASLKRIEAARAQVGAARAGYYPTVGLSAGWEKVRTSGMTTSPIRSATTVDYFNGGLSASWELDVFGKITAGVNQKKAQWRATRAESEAMMISVAAEIAIDYVNYRVAQQQLAVATAHSQSQERVVKIAQARHDAGLASALDVAQAQTVYYSTQATIPALRNQLNQLRNALATLIGVYPDSLPAALDSDQPMPNYLHMVETGVPADLLRRRPDIAEAEANLAAAAAAVGIAKKDFLPTLTINGSISTSAHRFDDLFSRRSIGYSIAPTLSWTLFSGFARKNALVEAKANFEAQIDSYNLTVMTAVAEADNAIYSYRTSLESIDQYNRAMEQSRKSYELSIDLYKSGNSDFTNVADAQMSYLTYSNQLIAARGDAVVALITLYKSLGGGASALN